MTFNDIYETLFDNIKKYIEMTSEKELIEGLFFKGDSEKEMSRLNSVIETCIKEEKNFKRKKKIIC